MTHATIDLAQLKINYTGLMINDASTLSPKDIHNKLDVLGSESDAGYSTSSYTRAIQAHTSSNNITDWNLRWGYLVKIVLTLINSLRMITKHL